jgi:GNAT superfamily N-acetyltransferase
MGNVVVQAADQTTGDQHSTVIELLNEHNAAVGFPFHPVRICLLLREDEKVAGGLVGNTNWNWLQIEVLYVAAHLRSRGHGKQLMESAEAMARTRGCIGAWLDTFSFQSAGFYEHLGYRSFGALPSYPGEERRIFFMKLL